VIEEGINDLMNLPESVIQNELIKRNFHPGVVRTLDFRCCVHLLRECQGESRVPQRRVNGITSLRSSKRRTTRNPIFGSKADFADAPDDDTESSTFMFIRRDLTSAGDENRRASLRERYAQKVPKTRLGHSGGERRCSGRCVCQSRYEMPRKYAVA
jgi:hypothetical protein